MLEIGRPLLSVSMGKRPSPTGSHQTLSKVPRGMIATALLVPVYAVPLAIAVAGWALHHRRRSRRNRDLLVRNRATGLAEPPGIHPRIDPARCIGCGACIRACPETDALGLIGRTAVLIEPWACIGHGTCRDACPTDAITLAIGTPTRGIAMPVLGPGGETSVAGIHIAGELGLGLIHNAIDQGRETIHAIADALGGGNGTRSTPTSSMSSSSVAAPPNFRQPRCAQARPALRHA
jgi:ferredoxin